MLPVCISLGFRKVNWPKGWLSHPFFRGFWRMMAQRGPLFLTLGALETSTEVRRLIAKPSAGRLKESSNDEIQAVPGCAVGRSVRCAPDSGAGGQEGPAKACAWPFGSGVGAVERHWAEAHRDGRGFSRGQVRLQTSPGIPDLWRDAAARFGLHVLLHGFCRGEEAALSRRSEARQSEDKSANRGVCEAMCCGRRGGDQEKG